MRPKVKYFPDAFEVLVNRSREFRFVDNNPAGAILAQKRPNDWACATSTVVAKLDRLGIVIENP
jgi:hypothetical protein